MDKPNETRQRKPVTPNTTDDESLTTSVASDTLDSWTLVNDKQKNIKTQKITHEDESHIEDLPKYEDLDLETSQSNAEEEQETEPTPEHHAGSTSATDEFSDEVSIISESENGDVLTPHPYLREHLHTLNLKFTTGEGLDLASLLQQQQQEEHRLQQKQQQITPPNTPIQLQQFSSNNNGNYQTRQRKRRSPSVDAIKKSLRAQDVPPPVPINSRAYTTAYIRRAYTWFFYVLVTLLLVGFYGKFAEWSIFGSENSASFDVLEKKLIDMELQNNLMRAEIDLLSKQVNHLKTASPTKNGERYNKRNQPYNDKKQYTQEEWHKERAKAWRTYENLEMQMTENQAELPNNVMETATENVENMPTEPATNAANMEMPEIPENQPTTDENKETQPHEYHDKVERFIKESYDKHNGKEKRDFQARNEQKFKKRAENAENFKHPHKRYNSKERDNDEDDDDSRERKNFKRNSNERFNREPNSKERRSKRENNAEKQHNDRNKMPKHENHNFKDHGNSKEQYRRTENFKKDNFKENQQQRRRGSEYVDKHSGEWHEKLMQQREKARNEHEQRLKHEKNWYLNRNEGREQWRSEEMNRR